MTTVYLTNQLSNYIWRNFIFFLCTPMTEFNLFNTMSCHIGTSECIENNFAIILISYEYRSVPFLNKSDQFFLGVIQKKNQMEN
jgi:hypothetical protein